MSKSQVLCPQCGAPISSGETVSGFCLSCLLTAGLAEDQPVHVLKYDHYEVMTDEQGAPIELGRGAMGITYRAIDTTLRSAVALKVIEPDLTDDPVVRERFMREARTAFRLRHPSVASVLYAGLRADNRCFYTMELVEGETLEARIRRAGPLPVSIALDLTLQIARALHRAEELGIVHRDLKPSNLMLTGSGKDVVVKVIDFGLARAVDNETDESVSTKNAFVGTPAFASPEHFTGAAHDSRSDFFSLGATLWYMLCGQPPFAGQTLEGIRQLQLENKLDVSQLRKRGVPGPVVQLLRDLLQKNPESRPQTAQELQSRLKSCQPGRSTNAASGKRSIIFSLVGLLTVGLAVAGLTAYWLQRHSPPEIEKSLAVLPFSNLNQNDDGSYFVDGIQDEILTDLAKVSELKVIGRNSVQSYRDAANRPRTQDIAKALGVTYLLEGSVLNEGDRLRVSARLLDGSNDRVVWGDHYEGDRQGLFKMQVDLAQQIVNQLRVELSATERTGIHKVPTNDFAAYGLYLRAKQLFYNFDIWDAELERKLDESVVLLKEATQRDDRFSDAWRLLSEVDIMICKYDPSAEHKREAYAALDHAAQVDPDAPENHLVRGDLLWRLDHKYETAAAEVGIALKSLPNSSAGFLSAGVLAWIQGQYSDVETKLVRANELDPRYTLAIEELGFWYESSRQYEKKAKFINRAIAAGVKSEYLGEALAEIPMDSRGEMGPFRAYLDSLPKTDDNSTLLTLSKLDLALRDRNFTEAYAVLAEGGKEVYTGDETAVQYPRSFLQGVVARAAGDRARAQAFFQEALPLVQKQLSDDPDYPEALYLLAAIHANLGQKEEALGEAKRMIELRPLEKDHYHGAAFQRYLAVIYTWSGEKDLAIQTLQRVAKIPLPDFNYGDLKLDPLWDDLRGDARFTELINEFAPDDLKSKNP
jgi:serine/threonine protein kinase/tetratricopeptide (TPR) repeat protein